MAADTPVRSAEALGPAPSTPSGIQQAKLFRIYNHYRLVVSLMLVALLFVDPVNFDMGSGFWITTRQASPLTWV